MGGFLGLGGLFGGVFFGQTVLCLFRKTVPRKLVSA